MWANGQVSGRLVVANSTLVGTFVETGEIPVKFTPEAILEKGKPKEVRIFNGRSYIMETALPGDVAILRAWKVDEAGNCVFK